MDHHLRALILHSFIQKINCTIIFFHPDCTVGPGISPDHASRLAGFTAGRELHPALKIGCCSIEINYRNFVSDCQPSISEKLDLAKGKKSEIPIEISDFNSTFWLLQLQKLPLFQLM